MPGILKIGILRETKDPPDKRVALPPKHLKSLLNQHQNIEVFVQPSDLRCFGDNEYKNLGIPIKEDLSECDILIGVKEVDIASLIPGKTYMFFAHVAKEQTYNRDLLRAILNKNIRLVDYEYMTDNDGVRLIAFGRWAGIVGAYNGLRGWGARTGFYKLKPAHECLDLKDMEWQLGKVDLNNARILISGGGRVAHGAVETLAKAGIKEIDPEDYLNMEYNEAVYCRIDPRHYVERIDGREFVIQHFFDMPSLYKSIFQPYTFKTDIYIAAHFWDPDSPRMFEINEMMNPAFRIKMIADISCDINGSVPSTLKASTIADPFYGFHPVSRSECHPFNPLPPVTMMTVDNLPGELPRDASSDFADVLLKNIMPELVGPPSSEVIERATITRNGKLTESFAYLRNYADVTHNS